MAATPQQAFKKKEEDKTLRKGARTPSSALPTAPVKGDLFYRTTEDRLYGYEGVNQVRGPWFTAAGRTGVRLRRVSNQVIATSTVTTISWDTEDQDTDAFITVPSGTITVGSSLTGLYIVGINVIYDAVIGARAFIDCVLDGVIVARINMSDNTEDTVGGATFAPIVGAGANRFDVFQASGSNKNLTARLTFMRIGA